MTQIYLIRHAEAEGNLYRRIHGWYNSLITENGYKQLDALEDRFRNVNIDAVS
ncbi:MAG: histidine phosphatase family protein, partial [Oscillospiraceae bacterium]